MVQRIMTAFMLTTGAGLFGLVAWIQSDRHALTSVPAPSEAVQLHVAPLRPAAEAPPTEVVEPILELPPVEVSGRRRVRAATPPAALPVAPEPAPVVPCSPWRDIGPAHVDDGVPSGVRRVRELC